MARPINGAMIWRALMIRLRVRAFPRAAPTVLAYGRVGGRAGNIRFRAAQLVARQQATLDKDAPRILWPSGIMKYGNKLSGRT